VRASAASAIVAKPASGAGARTSPGAGSAAAHAAVPTDPARQTQAEKRDAYIRNLDRTIKRDLFEPNVVYFPIVQTAAVDPAAKQGPTTTQPAEAARVAHEKFIRDQAKDLKLQTTILSASPTAIIDGRVLRVEDWIRGFQVVEITSQHCVVMKEDVKVTLRLQTER
jgi:hypothetical protein